MHKLANHAARDIASPAVKMGNKGLFPGVAVPLAFFCTLFFRHRKKSVSAPWDGKSLSAPESARHSPPGDLLTAKLLPIDASRVAFRSPPCTPFGSPPKAIERPIGLQALFSRRSRRVRPHQGELLTAKLSLVDASRGLSARPLHPFGSPPEAIERPLGRPVPIRAGVGASIPPREFAYGKVVAH